LDLYKEEIETETGTVNLTSRVTVIYDLGFPDISQEQVEFLLELGAIATGILAVVGIIAAAGSTTGVGALGAIIAAFINFPS